jgi:hypothetical protein
VVASTDRASHGRWIGSEDHKQAFCRSFIDTHRPFDPGTLDLPDLDDESLARLKALPIWNEAVRTEAETARKVQTLGAIEPDPLLSEAIALQGYEEGRHAAILRLLTERYGIEVEPFEAPAVPSDPVWEFLSTGYGECIDSFFAFGLFAIGKRSGYFPDALIDLFDPIMQEEARHVLFIVNWAAYLRARTRWFARPRFDARRTWKIAAQLLEHVRQAWRARANDGGGSDHEGFTMTSHSTFESLDARSFLELCLSENERRLRPYDPRLPRPSLVPGAVRAFVKILPRPGAPAELAAAPIPRPGPEKRPEPR